MNIVLGILWLIGGLAFLFIIVLLLSITLKLFTGKLTLPEYKQEVKDAFDDEGADVVLKVVFFFLIALIVVNYG
jgi:hypothetical protein